MKKQPSLKKPAKLHALAAIFAVALLVAGTFVLYPLLDPVGNHWKGYEVIRYELEGKSYKLLVADTPEKRTKGLMDIQNLNGFDGMIFVFDTTQTQTFWNKNTYLDLTVYWIVEDTVVGTSKLPSIDKAGKQTVTSPQPVDTVVEIVGYN